MLFARIEELERTTVGRVDPYHCLAMLIAADLLRCSTALADKLRLVLLRRESAAHRLAEANSGVKDLVRVMRSVRHEWIRAASHGTDQSSESDSTPTTNFQGV